MKPFFKTAWIVVKNLATYIAFFFTILFLAVLAVKFLIYPFILWVWNLL